MIPVYFKGRLIKDVFLKGDLFVDYLDRLHDILHQEDGLQLRQNVVQPADSQSQKLKFVEVRTFF